MNYRPDIDGLRAVAVLAVLGFHAFPHSLPGGFVGVDIFFVISGFLISTLLFEGLESGGFSLLDFYRRRIRRIFPALAVVVLFSLAAGWFMLFPDEYTQLGKHAAAACAFVLNFQLWSESGYFDNAAESKPLLHLWSLAVEEQFYIVWPLVLAALWKQRANVLLITLCIGFISFWGNVDMVGRSASAAFYWPTTRFWELMMGAAGAWRALYVHMPAKQTYRHVQGVLGALLIAAGFAIVSPGKAFPGWWALLPTVGALLIVDAGPASFFNKLVLSRSWLVAIGLISYPLYLWHWPLLAFLRIGAGGHPGDGASAVCLALSILLAWLTYALLEKKIRHSSRVGAVPALLGVFGVMFVASAGIALGDGLPSRGIAQTLKDFNDPDVFAGSRRSDGSCKALLGLPPRTEEVCLSNSSAPQLLIAGDSHAMALYSAIYAKKISMPAALLSAHGCQLYPELRYSPAYQPDADSACPGLARQLLAVAQERQSARVVVLATHYPPLDELPSPYKLGTTRLSNRQAFVEGLAPLIKGLLGAGKKVVFLVDVPYLKKDPRQCAQRLGFIAPQDCRYSRAEHDALRSAYMMAVRQLKASHPDVLFYDPTGFFCRTDMCEDRRGEHLLYNDANHLSTYASEALLDRMRDDGVFEPGLGKASW